MPQPIKGKRSKWQEAKAEAEGPRNTGEECTFDEHGEQATLTTRSAQIRTPEEALAKAGIDTRAWEVERKVVNSWEVAAFDKEARDFVVQPLWQVKLWLRRKQAKRITDAFDLLAERLAKYRVKPTKFKPSPPSGILLEASLFDVHFGKLCWAPETGQNYDVGIAERVYSNAMEDLLNRTSAMGIAKILLPVGSDFFHVDSWLGETTKGTRQDVDSRFPDVFATGFMAILRAIDLCSQIAPVDVKYVPGNHDQANSWYLCFALAQRFHASERVSVDYGPKSRKFVSHGINLIGFAHGDKEKHRDLPTVMASEVPELWGASKCREIHLGHWHKKKEMVHTTADEFGGTRVRILPSLSGTDAWHYGEGYVGTRRAAEAYLWHPTDGYLGHHSVNARES